jgi:hypothetical protein
MSQSIRSPRTSQVYQQLWELDEGFAQVHRALNGLQSSPGLHTNELARYGALAAEARAATLSYLLEILGERESKEAGQMFRCRRRRKVGSP